LRLSFPRKESRPKGGKAPFIFRAKALPLLTIPLLTLLIFSFQLLSSPALGAGEVAPSFDWPARGEVVNPFRPASGPYGAGGHAGIDISLSVGTRVAASAPGRVSFAGRTPVGTCVSVIHQGGFKTTYVSLKAAAVSMGEEVGRGEVVGWSDGSLDRSSSRPHLHFGMYVNGRAVDPLPFLRGVLLDPGECLFLGPWEDKAAVEAYFSRQDQGGFFGWIGRGLGSIGSAVAGFCGGALHMVGRGLVSAWKGVSTAFQAVGRGFKWFYNRCIEAWLEPVCRGVAGFFKWAFSNRYVQALVAGLAAALVICLAVAGAVLLLGISLATAVAAAVIGSIAAIAYALYYACTSGDSFSFTSCFLSSLAVGGAAAVSTLLFAYITPFISAGWAKMGLAGFAKSFLVHGCADSVIYASFCLITGREVSPMGMLASFLLGGFLGSVGKLFTTGLYAEGAVQAAAAGWLSSGGSLFSGETAARISTYIGTLAVNFAEKAAYAFFCGCTGFLTDVFIRALTGGVPSLMESLLSFGGGVMAGALAFSARGEGLSGLLARLTRGKLKLSSDLSKALLGKSFVKGLKKGLNEFLRRLTGGGGDVEQGIASPEIGGDG
jgi:hypothetical protein